MRARRWKQIRDDMRVLAVLERSMTEWEIRRAAGIRTLRVRCALRRLISEGLVHDYVVETYHGPERRYHLVDPYLMEGSTP